MLMNLDDLAKQYGMTNHVHGILHLGAHLAEEAGDYKRVFGDIPVTWVEGNPAVVEKILAHLQSYPTQRLVSALIYEVDGAKKKFNITNYDGMSSSMLEFGTHFTFSPDTIFVDSIELPTTTVDTLVFEHHVQADMLVMDLQGCELFAIRGATSFLKNVNYIMTEINKAPVYVGAAMVEELDEFLSDFIRVETFWVGDQGWGDGLYVRRGLTW